jgi:hypothetical protein
MDQIEVYAVEGLEQAVIGTAIRGAREVLTYDYDKALALLVADGRTSEEARKHLEGFVAADFYGAPIFVFLSNQPDSNDARPEPGTTVH